jgi:hypothetical protein
MPRSPQLPRLVPWVLFFASTLGVVAQITVDPPPNPPVRPASPSRPRAISDAAAERLRAAAPKYAPVSAEAATRTAQTVDERDQPRNRIIRLPAYEVIEPKIHVPQREREMLTPKGRLELAYKRHPGLRVGAIGPLKNDFWANALLDEEFAAERSAEINDLLGFLPGARRVPLVLRAPPNVIPARSGPWGGLFVPWERR